MSGHTGYTLDQLLEWCAQAHLIDGFKNDGEFVLILHDGVEKELDRVAAKKYLKTIFTGLERKDENDAGTGNGNIA